MSWQRIAAKEEVVTGFIQNYCSKIESSLFFYCFFFHALKHTLVQLYLLHLPIVCERILACKKWIVFYHFFRYETLQMYKLLFDILPWTLKMIIPFICWLSLCYISYLQKISENIIKLFLYGIYVLRCERSLSFLPQYSLERKE